MGHNCSQPARVQCPDPSHNSTHGPALELCLDDSLTIRSVSLRFLHRFSYSWNELVGQRFPIVLPPMVAELFERLPFPMDLKTLVKTETEFTQTVTYVTVVTSAKEYLRVKPQITYNDTRFDVPVMVVTLHEMRPGLIRHPQIPIQRMQMLANDRPCSPDKRNTVTLPDSVVVMFDMHNSTGLMTGNSVGNVVEVYHTLYSLVANELVKFEPFARLHETCGDSICLFFHAFGNPMLDPGILCRNSLVIARRCLRLMNAHLTSIGHGRIFMRCGIAFGDVVGSVIDGRTFRIFGQCMHRAARLEGLSDRETLYVDATIAKWNPDVEMQEKRVRLKGFPTSEEVYTVSTQTPSPPKKVWGYTEHSTLP